MKKKVLKKRQKRNIYQQTLFLLFLFIFPTIIGCQINDSEIAGGTGSVRFSIGDISDVSRSAGMDDLIDEAIGMLVSIQKSDGTPVYASKFLPIYNVKDSLITQPISLSGGDYVLTEFVVVGEKSALFLTPIEGSLFAGFVNDPLPIQFSVEENYIEEVVPEVIDINEGFPEQFGYTIFSIDIVKVLDVYVTAAIYDEAKQAYALTIAELSVDGDGEEINNLTLMHSQNRVLLYEKCSTYTFTIKKEGFQPWTKTLSIEELSPDSGEQATINAILLPSIK